MAASFGMLQVETHSSVVAYAPSASESMEDDAGAVVVSIAPLCRDESWRELVPMLTPSQRHRLASFTTDTRRREYVQTRALLVQLKSRLGSAPHRTTSVSHCPGHVAVAVCDRGQVGVDVESAPSYVRGVALRYFSRSQVDWIERAPAPERARLFRRLWTLHEASSKAKAQPACRDFPREDMNSAGAVHDLGDDVTVAVVVRRFRWTVAPPVRLHVVDDVSAG